MPSEGAGRLQWPPQHGSGGRCGKSSERATLHYHYAYLFPLPSQRGQRLLEKDAKGVREKSTGRGTSHRAPAAVGLGTGSLESMALRQRRDQ